MNDIIRELDEEEVKVVVKEIVVDILVDKGRSGRIGLILEGHLDDAIVVVGIRCNWDFEKGLASFVKIGLVERLVELLRIAHLVVVITRA